MTVLKSGTVFGACKYSTHAVEFQKRGLPHAHIICRFRESAVESGHVDDWVCGEVPDPVAQPQLHALVMKFMIHRPCSGEHAHLFGEQPCRRVPRSAAAADVAAPAVVTPVLCQKRFPAPLSDMSHLDERVGRWMYRRRDNGVVGVIRRRGPDGAMVNANVGHEWVVTYNAFLLAKYQCHINVDYCTSLFAVNYVFKVRPNHLHLHVCNWRSSSHFSYILLVHSQESRR